MYKALYSPLSAKLSFLSSFFFLRKKKEEIGNCNSWAVFDLQMCGFIGMEALSLSLSPAPAQTCASGARRQLWDHR